MNPEQNRDITVIEQQIIYYTCVLLFHYGTHRCCILFTGSFIENSLNVSLNTVLYVPRGTLFLALFRSMMHLAFLQCDRLCKPAVHPIVLKHLTPI